MDRFRSSFTAQFMDEEILSIEDYHKGEVLNVAEGQKHPLDFPQSNVLCYNLVSGDKICVRPSGTEPKIKFYVMIREDQGTLIEKKEKAKNKTNKVLEFIKKEAELS
jgi:phosphoglucomutase